MARLGRETSTASHYIDDCSNPAKRNLVVGYGAVNTAKSEMARSVDDFSNSLFDVLEVWERDLRAFRISNTWFRTTIRSSGMSISDRDFNAVAAASPKKRDADFPPNIQYAQMHFAGGTTEKLKTCFREVDDGNKGASPAIANIHQQMMGRHREGLKAGYTRISEREKREHLARAASLPKGSSASWCRLTGKLSKIKDRNETGALGSWQSDRAE